MNCENLNCTKPVYVLHNTYVDVILMIYLDWFNIYNNKYK